MNNLSGVAEQYSKKFPHYQTYAKCQSQAFMTGMVTFVGATAATFLGQEFFKSHFPWPRKTFILSSVVVGSVTAYIVTRSKTKQCQQIWMALEDKHTALSPVSEKGTDVATDVKEIKMDSK